MTRLPATKATAGPNHLNSQRHPVSDASLVEAAIERPTISPTSQRQAFPQGAWSHAQGVGWWLASGVHPEHGEAGRGQRLIAHTRQEHRCRSLGCPATKGCSPGEGLPLLSPVDRWTRIVRRNATRRNRSSPLCPSAAAAQPGGAFPLIERLVRVRIAVSGIGWDVGYAFNAPGSKGTCRRDHRGWKAAAGFRA
jgi:hypothetical protein